MGIPARHLSVLEESFVEQARIFSQDRHLRALVCRAMKRKKAKQAAPACPNAVDTWITTPETNGMLVTLSIKRLNNCPRLLHHDKGDIDK